MRKLTFILAILNILVQQNPLKAQDSVQVVILSQRTGLYIEPEERSYYNLFSTDNNFVLAYFTRDSVDSYTAVITWQNDKGLQERKVKIKKMSLLNFGERINNYEKIKAKNYTMGENRVEPEFVWVKKSDIDNKIKELTGKTIDYPLLKAPDTDYANLFKHYPRFGISAGSAYTNFKFDELNSLTDKIDNHFKAKGYDVHPLETDYNLGSILRFKGIVEFTADLSAVLMLDYNIINEDIKYNAVTLMGLYSFTGLMNNFVPFAGLGYTRNNFNINVDYGSTIIDTLQGMLEAVIVDGGTEGLIAEAGIKALIGNSFSIGIAADYYFLTTYKYEVDYMGFSSEIKPGNLSAGIFFNILF